MLDDSFEEGSHQLVRRYAALLQAVDIGFGEYAALAGYRVQLDVVIAHLAKLLGRDAELGVDLVDYGACAAGALIVHRRNFFLAAGDWIFFEDDDLGVLAAQFNDGAALGIELFYREGYGVYFLHEFCAEQGSHAAAAAAGDENAAVAGDDADFLFHALEELHDFFGLLGVMALVVLPEDFVVRGIYDYGFDGG